MPELPEVETIRRQLEKEIINKRIKEVLIKDRRLIKGVSSNVFKSKAEGAYFKKILRRGKVLILQIKKNSFIIFHLRISGWIMLSKNIEEFSRVIFKLSNNNMLEFCDQRALGEIRLVDDWHSLPIVKKMGPEPFDLKREEFIGLFKARRTKIKPLLMDQSFLAGVGNAYAQEAVFCAGVNPQKGADSLREEELNKIYDCLIGILKESLNKKGSSLDTYRQLNGAPGGYAPLLRVYGRKDKPCFRCGYSIERKVIGGRGTYFCPHCQK